MNDEILIPTILPAYDDGVFKAILTHPDAGPVLRDAVSSVLLVPVRDVEIRNIEPPITDISDKREKFDVNCKTDSGEQTEIEMQADPMEGDSSDNRHEIIRSRTIYNLCDLHSSQPGRGTRYDKLMRSFQVTFCGYTVFAGREDFVNRFGLRNEAGEELSGAVGVIFVELTKLGKVLKKPRLRDDASGDVGGVFRNGAQARTQEIAGRNSESEGGNPYGDRTSQQHQQR
jgi:predicted transposase/invertase (TIGR01784 family)